MASLIDKMVGGVVAVCVCVCVSVKVAMLEGQEQEYLFIVDLDGPVCVAHGWW